MTKNVSECGEPWVNDAIDAAKHLSLCHYNIMRPGRIALDDVAASFKTTMKDFMQNRGGIINVDVRDDGRFEVTVKVEGGLMTIAPRSVDC